MSSRREVFIRILALLQRKTLIETKNRTLKCLKRHYSTVRSMKNLAVLTKDGAFALFCRPHPGGFDSSRVPTPGKLRPRQKNANARGSAGGGGGVLGAAGIDWCITQTLSRTDHERGKVRHFHVQTVWFYIPCWLFTVITVSWTYEGILSFVTSA